MPIHTNDPRPAANARSRAFVLLTVSVILFAACGASGSQGGTPSGSGARYCYRPREVGTGLVCECYPTEQNRPTRTWDSVTTCGSASDVCSADVRTGGRATTCACVRAGCYQDANNYCVCLNGGPLIGQLDTSTARPVASCGSQSSSRGCCMHDHEDVCECYDGVPCRMTGVRSPIPACNLQVLSPYSLPWTLVANCDEVSY